MFPFVFISWIKIKNIIEYLEVIPLLALISAHYFGLFLNTTWMKTHAYVYIIYTYILIYV